MGVTLRVDADRATSGQLPIEYMTALGVARDGAIIVSPLTFNNTVLEHGPNLIKKGFGALLP